MKEPDLEPRDLRMAISPPVTEALRDEARKKPGTWVYAVDQGFVGASSVPPQAIVGAWRSDERGELSEDFTPNPRYSPTPQARGWDEPVTELEWVLQLVLAGYVPGGQLDRVFAEADVFIFGRPEGGVFLAPAADGGRLVYAYTDAEKAASAGGGECNNILGIHLARLLPEGVRIVLNPGSEISIVLFPGNVLNS